MVILAIIKPILLVADSSIRLLKVEFDIASISSRSIESIICVFSKFASRSDFFASDDFSLGLTN